jgi:hypothetical protein
VRSDDMAAGAAATGAVTDCGGAEVADGIDGGDACDGGEDDGAGTVHSIHALGLLPAAPSIRAESGRPTSIPSILWRRIYPGPRRYRGPTRGRSPKGCVHSCVRGANTKKKRSKRIKNTRKKFLFSRPGFSAPAACRVRLLHSGPYLPLRPPVPTVRLPCPPAAPPRPSRPPCSAEPAPGFRT